MPSPCFVFGAARSPLPFQPRRSRSCLCDLDRAPSVARIRACSAAPAPASAREQYSPESFGFLHIATITSAHGVHGAVKVTTTTDFPAHRLSPTTESKYVLFEGRKYPRPVTVSACRPTARPDVWIVHLSCMGAREDFLKLKLRSARLYVRAADRPPLARGEFIAADLVDLRVCLLLGDTKTEEEGKDKGEGDGEKEEENEEEMEIEVGYTTRTRKRGEIRASRPFGIVEEIIPRQSVSASALANDVLQIALYEKDDDAAEDDIEMEIDEDSKRVLVPFVKQLVPVVDLAAGVIVIDPPAGLLDIAVVNRKRKPVRIKGLLMAGR